MLWCVQTPAAARTNTASQNGEIELRLHYAFVRTIAQVWEYRNINAFYDDVAVNRPPHADASATAPVVISANPVDAEVVLDGSRSWDPDGDPLHYLWYQAGVAGAIATGVGVGGAGVGGFSAIWSFWSNSVNGCAPSTFATACWLFRSRIRKAGTLGTPTSWPN